MKLEFLPDGSADCPLIRLYEFDDAEIIALRAACIALGDGSAVAFELHAQPWVRAIGAAGLVLQRVDADRGIHMPVRNELFVLRLSDEGWREIADKLTPLIEHPDGYHWLSTAGDVSLLASRSGTW